ncbi:MAG: glycoside hydrolase family 2 protein [Acidobacteriaceae bacterium]
MISLNGDLEGHDYRNGYTRIKIHWREGMQLFRIWRFAFFVLLLVGISSISVPRLWAAANQSMVVNSGWEFRQSTDVKGTVIQGNWLPAKVPGDVHLDLLRNKLIPRPFYRNNEARLQWIENVDWEYRTRISVSSELLGRKNLDLVFDGLDTCARVYVNGRLVLTSHNMFRTYRIDVKSYLKSGGNQLLISFPSPIRCAAAIAEKDRWRSEIHAPARSYLRKAAYEYGWDGGPRFVTSGIWRPVRLEAWDSTRISDFGIRQLDVTRQSAHILAEVEVISAENTLATIEVTGKHVFESASQITVLHPGINHVELPLTIENPELWYPVGYGWQPIYGFAADVKTKGVIQDTRHIRAPLRSLQLRRKQDRWGRSFEFVVNGIPVFVKGAIIVPFDSFPSRVPKENIRYILQAAKDANMNMVRVWGGGYYEPKDFYELCDELGIMVWQDFMFESKLQPGTYSFRQNVATEVRDQLKRLRNYRSITLWCGNCGADYDFRKHSIRVTSMARLQMWKDYLSLFDGIIPTEIERYAPGATYWSSSPNVDYGKTRAMNHEKMENEVGSGVDDDSGDTHDSGVSAFSSKLPKTPFGDEDKIHSRFVSEYGFQSFPDMRTIDAFTLPRDRTSPSTPVMMAHEKAVAARGGVNGYQAIRDYMIQDYGRPKNFVSMVYLSGVLQAERIKVIAEQLRQDRPRNMGSIFGQLNDCWPGVTRSSIDYYGRWKALQYYARRFYAPLLVSPSIGDGNLNIDVVSDETLPTSANLRVRVMKFDGTVVTEKNEEITIPALSSHTYVKMSINNLEMANKANVSKVFAAMDLAVNGKKVSSNLTYFIPTKQVHLPATHIERRLTGTEGSYDLHLSSRVLARSVYISFGDSDATLSDNYFDLLPRESQDIHIDSKASLDQLTRSMKIISLVDAIVSNPSDKGFAWE